MKSPSLKLFSFVLCLLALLLCVADVSAQQCGANGSVGCGAPVISQLNTSLATQLAQNSSSAASSATSSPRNFAVPQTLVTVPQQIQVAPQQVQVQAPQVQYVQVPAPQVQYVQQPVQYVQTLPQVQFSTQQLAFSAPAALASAGSASASSSAASTALPIVAAQPAAILTGCASGNCGGRAGLLQALRRPAKSVSVSRSRTRG